MNSPFPKPQEEEWEDPYPKKKPTQWFSRVILLFALYILSVGPAFRLAQNGAISWTTIEMIYTPLNLAARFDPIDTFVQWYIRDVWQIKTKPPSAR